MYVRVGVSVGVRVAVDVCVCVAVAVGVEVSVAVGATVCVGVAVAVTSSGGSVGAGPQRGHRAALPTSKAPATSMPPPLIVRADSACLAHVLAAR